MTHEAFDLSRSRALYERARAVMPGGVNASARFNPTLKQPLFMERGQGAYLYDVDGHRYIDYCVSHGASLLGHGHPAVVAAVQSVLARGILCACETEEQLAVAERLLPLFPGAEMVRFTGSGTEATWHVLRLARTYTGRWGVAKFEGHYHGVNDTLGFSCRPAPELAGPSDAPYAVPD
jgi:glutamate-1-semialdehyde 2,1-aminomutase